MNAEDHLKETNNHVVTNIQFADQKATAFVAINSAVLATLYSGKLLILAWDGKALPWEGENAITSASAGTFAFLGLGILFALWVLIPRGENFAKRMKGGELAIPNKIAHFKDVVAYRDAVVAAAGKQGDLAGQWAALVVARCRTSRLKYILLKVAIFFSMVGYALLAGLITLHTLSKM